ncbi:MAG: serine/threonine protein kinase, partial [Planctomycetes bacterium]|nr:serine/threonine protein kinase [Planctomycetota bacterium]
MKDERLERLRFQISEDLAAGTQKSVAEYAALFPNQDLLVSRAYVEAHTLGLNILDASDEGEFIGPYRLEKELGRGGQGVVYLAEDTRLHRRVALKVLQGLGPDAKTHLQRFRREAEVASKLDHPGICGVYEAGMAGEIPFIAMRFVEGETLAAITDRAKQAGSSAPSELLSTFFLDARDDETTDASVSAEASDESRDQKSSTRATSVNRKAVNEVLSIYEKAARALHVAHEAGIIHRDIKPGNIMITRDREPVLLDFGLAREETSDLASLTMTGDVFGTPAYMSPEQVRGERGSIDRRSDTYSLGVSLFESLTLRRPFESATRQGLYQQILSSEAPGARQFNSAIPRDLEVVLETVLAKNKDHRYQTAAAFADELGHVLRMEPIVSRPSGPLVKTLRWAQRNPALAVALSALVLCISVGLIVALISLARTRRALAGERHARTEAEEVTNFFERVLQSVDPGIKGADVSVLEVL